ncbi:hypothetical protein TL16_g13283, partial [Triparma laevis f. inornata]
LPMSPRVARVTPPTSAIFPHMNPMAFPGVFPHPLLTHPFYANPAIFAASIGAASFTGGMVAAPLPAPLMVALTNPPRFVGVPTGVPSPSVVSTSGVTTATTTSSSSSSSSTSNSPNLNPTVPPTEDPSVRKGEAFNALINAIEHQTKP